MEILMARVSNDYGNLVKKLDYGFTNDQVKDVTGEYIQFLKDELLNIQTEQDGWIEDSTHQLDELRDNLNQGEVTVDNYDNYMENLRTSWKAKADENINADSAAKLNAMADSIDDYKTRLSAKIPSGNALNGKVQNFLDTYKAKIMEVAGFLEANPENVGALKDQVKGSIDKIVDENKEFGQSKKTEAVQGLNSMKDLVNTKLFKSLNGPNLKYILHNTVADAVSDVDKLEDPNKPSNFIFERDDMKEFALRVSKMIKEMTASGDKVAWNMRTKEIQKVMDDGKAVVQASSDGDKVLNLQEVQDKLVDINAATSAALDNDEIKTNLNDLIVDTVNYEKVKTDFDTSAAKNTALYGFLTKDITETSLSTPARILHVLNKEELKAAGKLSREDRDTLKFVRSLLQKWESLKDRPQAVRALMSDTFQVMTGFSNRNLKFVHKFDLGAAVNKFKAIYTNLTNNVDSGLETSNKLTGKIETGQGRLTSLTKHLDVSTLVGTELSGFSKLFSFLPWIKKPDTENKRVLFDLSSFKTMKDKLEEAHANAKKVTQEVQEARDFTKEFEEGFEILKQFA
jgi:hypothetical protein